MADRRSAKSFKARFSRADGTWSQPIGRSSTSDTRSGFNGPLAGSLVKGCVKKIRRPPSRCPASLALH